MDRRSAGFRRRIELPLLPQRACAQPKLGSDPARGKFAWVSIAKEMQHKRLERLRSAAPGIPKLWYLGRREAGNTGNVASWVRAGIELSGYSVEELDALDPMPLPRLVLPRSRPAA